MRSVFSCKREDRISGQRILLVDDVMTTGATLASATSVLLSAGASRVCCLTLARAISND
jgi:predicted amidophosphoribosyltransferase